MTYELLKVQVLMLGPSILFGLILLAFAFRLDRKKNTPREGSWSLSACFAFAYALSYCRIEGIPTFSPQESWKWLFALAIFSGLFNLLLLWRKFSLNAVLSVAFIFSSFAGYLLVPSFQEPLQLWRIGVFASIFILIITLQPLAQRRSGPTLPFLWSITYLGSSFILIEAGIAKFAQFCGLMALLSGLPFLLSLRIPSISFGKGAIYPLSLILSGLLYNGYFTHYSDVPAICFIGVILVPLFAWIGQIPFISKRSNRTRFTLEILIPLLLVIILCGMANQPPVEESLY